MTNKHLGFAVLSLLLAAGPAAAQFGPGDGDLKIDTRASAQLKGTADMLCGNQSKLIGRVETTQNTLQTSAYALGTLSVLEADLKALSTAVESLYSAAKAAEAIPQSREKARKVRESLEGPRQSLKKASLTMSGITAKTEPMRAKLQSAADKTGKVKTALTVMNEVPCNTRSVVDAMYTCIGAMPKKQGTCASAALEERAAPLRKAYYEYDKAIRPLLYSPSMSWLPPVDFLNPFNDDLRAIENLRSQIEPLVDRMQQLADQLGPLNAVLDQNFGFSFPYPNPTLTNPFRVSYYDVNIKGRIIAEGVGAIEDAIERVLSSFLWETLKGLGVDKYVRQLQDAFNSATDAALKAVHFDIDVQVPSLDAIDNFSVDELALEELLKNLDIPEPDVTVPGLKLPGFPADLGKNELLEYMKDLNLAWKAPGTPAFCGLAAYDCR